MTRSIGGKLTLGQLCRRVGLARTSILHYESLGLLAASGRSGTGYRLYGEPELERLRTIRRLRDAGLSLADIGTLLTSLDAATSGKNAAPGVRPAALLEKRLLGLCQDAERIRKQQRLLARLLAVPFPRPRQRWNKSEWVSLLRRAGFDEEAMRTWHIEFEHESPKEHAAFLKSLGLESAEVTEIRRWSKMKR